MTRPIALLCSTALTLLSLTAQAAEPKADAAPRPQLGNGEENRIVVEGMKHGGRTFTFPEVEIAKPGWLVLHPFGPSARPPGRRHRVRSTRIAPVAGQHGGRAANR